MATMTDPSQAGMSSLLMQAAHSAAQADGLLPSNIDGMSKASASALQQARSAIAASNGGGGRMAEGKKKGPPLRRGKWTPEEEAYANRLIQEFKAGLLPLTDGTTLRTFLSKLLNCDPMRISKKFVGNNCIGKQVFRRRNADLNRLTPEQIQQSRAELSELERRFLERVAQTNRVKSSGVASAPATTMSQKPKEDNEAEPPSPPWLQPPIGYRHGTGAAFAAANLSGANSRAAAAGRALLGGVTSSSSLREALERKTSQGRMPWNGSAGFLAMAEMQQRASQQNLLQNALNQGSASNLLSGRNNGFSNNAMAQLSHNASAARLASLASNPSMSSLFLKSGFSREQLSQLAQNRGLSSGSLSNMIQRQNSFDALMSLDFQSLQSIDNLANLMQTGGVQNLPETGMKNADFGSLMGSRQNLAAAAASNEDLSNAARRLASAGRMESLLKTLSTNSMRGNNDNGGSSANFSNLLQSLQQQGGAGNVSAASLLGAAGGSAVNLANALRQDSSTGLSALRMQDGLNQRNSSVDDFLSLVAAGDIPHQDPSLLNVPLMQQQGGSEAAAKLLAQQQMLQASGNAALANALASRSLSSMHPGNHHHQSQNAGNKRRLEELGQHLQSQGRPKK